MQSVAPKIPPAPPSIAMRRRQLSPLGRTIRRLAAVLFLIPSPIAIVVADQVPSYSYNTSDLPTYLKISASEQPNVIAQEVSVCRIDSGFLTTHFNPPTVSQDIRCIWLIPKIDGTPPYIVSAQCPNQLNISCCPLHGACPPGLPPCPPPIPQPPCCPSIASCPPGLPPCPRPSQ